MAWSNVSRTVDRVKLSNGKRTARREYVACWVQADGPVSASAGLSATAGGVSVDAYYSSYPDFPGCLATDIDIDHLSPFDLKIVVNFADPDLIPFDQPENLLSRPAVITESWDAVDQEYVMDADEPPDPVVNSAGTPFDRGPTRLKTYIVFKIEKYVDAAGRSAIRNAANTINRIPRLIEGDSFGERELLLCMPEFKKISGESIYLADFQVRWNSDLWVDEPLDVGWQAYGSNGQLRDIKQTDSETGKKINVARPWPLLADGTASPTNQPGDFQTKIFYPYKTSDWIGVPLS